MRVAARRLGDPQRRLRRRSSTRSSRTARSGTARTRATTDPVTGEIIYDFNTDEIVKFPGAVALIWRWTGDDRFRDELLDFTRRNLEYVRTELDEDGDGWPEGNGNVERPGMGEEKLDNTVFYIRGLYDYADMARSAGQRSRADAAEARADALAARFEQTWWVEADQQYADSLRDPGNVPINQKHWIGVNPMEVELYRDGEFVPGLGTFDHGNAALATRENSCYSGERPGNRGLFHTGCGGGPTGAGEFAIFSLNTACRRSARATTAASASSASAATPTRTPRRSSASRRPCSRPTSSRARCRRSCRPTRLPASTGGTPPNIDRCWTCRSMFMQAWGHYGNAWPVVHQQLGVRPHLGRDFLEVVPQVPDGETRVQGADIRLGGGAADVLAAHDGNRYTTVTDTDDTRVRDFRIGHTLPRGSQVASVRLDGRSARYTTRTTNRGLEVRVRADADRRHTLVVTAAP